MNWRQNPTRVAWLILMASFLSCCLLAVAVPVGARSYLLHATKAKVAYVQATAGTAELWLLGADEPTAVTRRRTVAEGSRIVTDATAKALLTLATDESGQRVVGTVQLSPNTAAGLLQARSPRFNLSGDPHRVALDLVRGRMSVASQRADGRDVRVQIATPQATIACGVGTFDVMIAGDETRVRVRSGAAQVLAEGREVTVGKGERVSVAAGLPPELPVPDTVNLIVNGNFEPPLEPLWEKSAEVKPGHEPGTVELVPDGRRNAVKFVRRTEDGVPNRVVVTQVLDRDVQGYDSLALRLDLKLLYQSVPGGGEKATEYPVMVDLFYTDVYGKDLHWYQGFYYLGLPPNSPYLPPTGEQVPLGFWYTYESPNLFDLLSATRPAHINTISIYAIGHDYESMVSDVALTVQ